MDAIASLIPLAANTTQIVHRPTTAPIDTIRNAAGWLLSSARGSFCVVRRGKIGKPGACGFGGKG